jgi:hypothetical protein
MLSLNRMLLLERRHTFIFSFLAWYVLSCACSVLIGFYRLCGIPRTPLGLKISSRSAGSVWSGTVAAVRSRGCLFILFSRFFSFLSNFLLLLPFRDGPVWRATGGRVLLYLVWAFFSLFYITSSYEIRASTSCCFLICVGRDV